MGNNGTDAKKKKACNECSNFLYVDKYKGDKNYWYNHRCKVFELPKKINPDNYKEEHYSYDPYGKDAFTDRKYRFCEEVVKISEDVDGNCKYFKLKND